MKNKGYVVFLAVIIAALCLFHISFSFVSNDIDQEIEAYAQNKKQTALTQGARESIADTIYRNAVQSYRDSIRNETMFLGRNYEEVKNFALDLGLDLQGGMHITLAVSPNELIHTISGNKKNEKFTNALESAKKRQRTEQVPYTTLFYQEYQKAVGITDRNDLLWRIFSTPDNPEINAKTTDEEILKMLDTQLDDAVKQSRVVLNNRLDAFGATQPTIEIVQSTGRIEVELPGVDDRARVEGVLKRVAKLEFLDVVPARESQQLFQQLQPLFPQGKVIAETAGEASPDAGASEDLDDLQLDASEPQDFSVDATEEDTMANSTEVEDTGAVVESEEVEEETAAEFRKLPLIEISNEMGLVTQVKYKKKLQEFVASEDIQNILPRGVEVMIGTESEDGESESADGYVSVYFIQRDAQGNPLLEGDVITRATQSFDERGGVAVSMIMNDYGTKEWARITGERIGQQVAIALDGTIFSAPVVRGKITGGSSQISGNFDVQEAKDLSNVLEAGKLPVKLELERIIKVGPSLGQESIERGLLSLAAGLMLVVLFMVMYYAKGGLIANAALLFNIFFILGILSVPAIGATLTLPGIAGIVLTIGMSIDANVLIFERIREEIKNGLGKEAAINLGYKKAFWTIFDANFTTLITAIILFSFGSGPVKGFAVTLMIGVACSFFSAVYITRLIIEYTSRRKNFENMTFETGISKKLFQNVSGDFMKKRKVAYAFSLAFIIVGMITVFIQGGLNLGVAFKGGREYVVHFDDAVNPSAIRSDLKDVFGEAGTMVKHFDGVDQVQVKTTYLLESDTADVDAIVEGALMTGLQQFKDLNPEIRESKTVNPSISSDIRNASIQSIIISLIAIFLYIILRFQKWQFGLGAIVALFHDVLFVISAFSIARLVGIAFEVDEVFVAAILTVVGYSINDTVVVFDRVREYLGFERKEPLEVTLNKSINSTISRTLMTSMTTLLVILVLLIFGGEALRGFSFALFVGVVIGTYSSIFVATPVVLDSTNVSGKKLEEKKKEDTDPVPAV